MRPNKEVATRGGVDTPHSDVRNGSNDHGVAGVRPGVVVVAYDGEERRGIKLLRGVFQRAEEIHRKEIEGETFSERKKTF